MVLIMAECFTGPRASDINPKIVEIGDCLSNFLVVTIMTT